MKQKIVRWFLNWANKRFPQYWEVSYVRMGKYAAGHYLCLSDARRRAHKVVVNYEEAETLEKACNRGSYEAQIKHFINIQGICLIEVSKDREVFRANRPVNVSDAPTY